MKCGLSLGTAREKVRVANALFDLPLISEQFREGALSYSKVRAMTRCEDIADEKRLVESAISSTVSQVEEHYRQLHNADRRHSTPDANRAFKGRYLSRTCHANGTMGIHMDLPQEIGEVIMKAVETAMSQAPSLPEDDLFQKQADAMLEVVVHVTESTLRDESGKSDLPVETVRRIGCDADVVAVTEDQSGNVLSHGRKQRVVSPQLRRAVLARDRHCKYPVCSHTHYLDAHHVMRGWLLY
jgi:hypothetical protein